jgi:hypothetical protein
MAERDDLVNGLAWRSNLVGDLRMVSGNDYCLCAQAADEIILLRERVRECFDLLGELISNFEATEFHGDGDDGCPFCNNMRSARAMLTRVGR